MRSLRLGVLDERMRFGEALVGFLAMQGIAAELHAEPDPLLARLAERPPSLLIVHEADGRSILPVLRLIRSRSRVPCIVVGEVADPDRGIGLLEAGADDLIPSATPLPILLARMQAVLRRGAWGLCQSAETTSAQASGGWRLARERRELFRPDGSECHLTTAEFDLLRLLADRAPGPVTRAAICREVLRRRWREEDRTVDNLVVRLRRKLGDETRGTIRTLQGQGYAFTGFPGPGTRQG